MAILKRWTGSIWTPARRILYWNGSSWIEKNFKYWDGAAWQVAITKEGWVDDYVSGLWHLNEQSGTSSADATGKGHTMNWGQYATADQPVWTAGGKPGWGYLAFDQKKALVNYHSDFDFGTSPFTIEAWVSGGTINTTINEVIIGRYSGTLQWWLGYHQSTGYGEFLVKNTAGSLADIQGSVNLHTEVWHYLVGVKDDTYIRFYVDGAQVAYTTHPGGTYDHATANVCIGWFEGTTEEYRARCNMGELRISKGIARTTGEIADIWNANA